MKPMNAKDDILKSKCKLRVLFLGPHTDDVDIGANTTIDRGTIRYNYQKGTKIDNLVHIAHGDEIGEQVIITAGVQ
jgi:hypothetical protein